MVRRFWVLALLCALGRPAAAEGLALSLDPAPAGEHGIVTQGADVRGRETFRVRLLVDYAHEPLVLQNAQQKYDRVVAEQLWFHALASFAFRHRLLLGVDLPVLALADPSNAPALADPRITARARLFGHPSESFHFGIAAGAWLPFGSADAFASDGSARFSGSLVLDYQKPRFRFALENGVRTRPSQTLPGVLPSRVGTELVSSAFAGFAVDSSRDVFLGSELSGFVTVTNGAKPFDPRSSGALFLVEGRWLVAGGPLELGGGVGPGIGTAPGVADFRALAFVGFGLEAPPPPPDRDDDRIPDKSDACMDLPGVPSSDPVMNGCPEVPPDFDGDGIPDENDACPKEPGEPTGKRGTHGCPKPVDTDSDGIPNKLDACPDVQGVESKDPAKNGCPPPPPPAAILTGEAITISEQVQFEHGTAVLRPESDAILKEVLDVLDKHPEIEQVEVQGHTDDTGTPEINLKLSTDRANAVVAWLVAHGAAKERLTGKGYGETKPIADNADEAGRAKNRRVEFRVVKQKGTEP